jgi:hypothetical protein
MTAKLEQILSEIDTLSKADLRVVQDHVSEKLEEENPATQGPSGDDEKMKSLLKVGYRLSSQDLKRLLFSFLSPEELAELEKNKGTGEYPTLPKTITEYIDEDREDRI